MPMTKNRTPWLSNEWGQKCNTGCWGGSSHQIPRNPERETVTFSSCSITTAKCMTSHSQRSGSVGKHPTEITQPPRFQTESYISLNSNLIHNHRTAAIVQESPTCTIQLEFPSKTSSLKIYSCSSFLTHKAIMTSSIHSCHYNIHSCHYNIHCQNVPIQKSASYIEFKNKLSGLALFYFEHTIQYGLWWSVKKNAKEVIIPNHLIYL